MTTLSEIKSRIILTLTEYDPVKIGLFGSYFLKTNTGNSDIDILVRFRKPKSLLELIRIENKLSAELGIKVDLITEGALNNPIIRKSIEANIEVLFEA